MGCRSRKAKEELIRFVRAASGTLVVEAQGPVCGRGVYICRNVNCLKKAQKKVGSIPEVEGLRLP
jgi:predicted RNA-binding protein YlxR (DUF448 family)